MITRHYFYRAKTTSINSRSAWGLVTTKSWFPIPLEATEDIRELVKDATGAEGSEVSIVTFNRV